MLQTSEVLPSFIQEFSPTPVVTTLTHQGKKTFVVRDDVLPGGTKQRAAYPFLRDMMKMGVDHFIYASPFSGFAQVAIAYVAKELNVRCTLICEKDQRFPDRRFHPFSMTAQEYGAQIIMADSLPEAEELATAFEREKNDYKIPLGLDCPLFKHHLKHEFVKAFEDIEAVHGDIKTLWLPVGSGTLARTMLSVIPSTVKLKCVNVRVLDSKDTRIEGLSRFSNVYFFHAPMTFHTPANDFPDIPSNVFYDAKLWAFIKEHGEDGDFWWNVAK